MKPEDFRPPRTSVEIRREMCQHPKWKKMHKLVASHLDRGELEPGIIFSELTSKGILEGTPSERITFRRHFRKQCERRRITLLPWQENGRIFIPLYLRQKIYHFVWEQYNSGELWEDIRASMVARKDFHIDHVKATRIIAWLRRKWGLEGEFCFGRKMPKRSQRKEK